MRYNQYQIKLLDGRNVLCSALENWKLEVDIEELDDMEELDDEIVI